MDGQKFSQDVVEAIAKSHEVSKEYIDKKCIAEKAYYVKTVGYNLELELEENVFGLELVQNSFDLEIVENKIELEIVEDA